MLGGGEMLSLVKLTAGTNGAMDKRFSARGSMGAKGKLLIVITRSTSRGAGGGFEGVYDFCRIPVFFFSSGRDLNETVKGRCHTYLTIRSRGFTGTVVGRM